MAGIKNRGSQVHHVKRGDLLAKEHAQEIYDSTQWDMSVPDPVETIAEETKIKLLSQKQRSQLRSYGN